MPRTIKRLACKMAGHKFDYFCDGLKRRCSRCEREEWVMSRPYALIGEAQHYWAHMAFDELNFRRRRPHPNSATTL